MPAPKTESRQARRERLAGSGAPARSAARAGASAPAMDTAGSWTSDASGTVTMGPPVQLELGCPAAVLLSRDAAAGLFGRDERLDAWADFIAPFFPGEATFLTFTYSDEGGERFKAYRPAAVFGDVQRFLTSLNYEGPAFFVTEEHHYRRVLHAHGLVHGMEKADRLRLMAMWEQKRGYARALPATAGAFPYVVKYALKNNDSRGDCVDLRHLTGFVPHVKGKRS